MAAAWDQCPGVRVLSPIGAKLEDVALGWLIDVLALPAAAGGGFTTGATTANFSALAAARHALLAREGWDVESRGLFGAPPITVIVGDEFHASMKKALAMAGLGRDRVTRVPVDGQGRMRADALPPLEGPTLVCVQAGNVNTGAFDPAEKICRAAAESGAWVHVDGAFGLWAAASPKLYHHVRGYDLADSWALDAHKWLNVPYDSGLVFVRDASSLQRAMSTSAEYILVGDEREPHYQVPEMSRRIRGAEVWAALRSLGRSGLAEMIERCCRHARRFADGLRAAGWSVLNDVELNQVLVSFGGDEATDAVARAVQREGTCWCGGTRWQGRTAMRIAVSSWATTDADVERSLRAMLDTAARVAREK
jgi:glutamate/tyrosine decarboxylase-like PLP-dependent enzyme